MTPGNLPAGVCVVTQPARRRGEKTHAFQLCRILDELTEVSVLTANLSPDSPLGERFEVVEVSKSGTGTAIWQMALRFIVLQLLFGIHLVRRDEEVIIFFGTTAYLLPMVGATMTGKTVVVEPRGNVPLSLRLAWEERVPAFVASGLATFVSALEHVGYRLADGIVTYTPAMADELGLRQYSGKLHTNGARYVDTGHFRPDTPLSDRPRAAGYLGRLDVEKAVPTLVEVVKRLVPDVQFRFVGDGDHRDVVESELADEIDAGDVVLTGWVDHEDVPRELNRMRLLLLPSEPTEGLPTAILEAFACGTPVYATPVSSVPDVVRDGETGFLMTERDPESIATTVRTAFEDDTLSEMSGNCRAMAESEFSFEASVSRYRSILEVITDRSAD